MKLPLIPTTLCGSYVQPSWLVDRTKLTGRPPSRAKGSDVWQVDEEDLEEAQDAATLMAIRTFEEAGLDILTDGEIRRESYSNRFHNALDGIDVDNPAMVPGRSPGRMIPVPRIAGPLRRRHPVEVRDTEFLRRHTDRTVKMTLPGPFTLSQVSVDEHYGDEEEVIMTLADIVREEVRDLFAAGADVVQLDEPWMQARPEKARQFAVKAINHALRDAAGATVVHLCFGYAYTVKDKPSGYSFLPELDSCVADQISIEAAQPNLDLSIVDQLPSKQIMVGVIDLASNEPETAEQVAGRLRRALDYLPADRVVAAPDCGMKYLDPAVARAKLQALTDGAAIVRKEISN